MQTVEIMVAGRNVRRVTEDEKAVMRRLRDEDNESYEEIANKTGRTISCVYRYLNGRKPKRKRPQKPKLKIVRTEPPPIRIPSRRTFAAPDSRAGDIEAAPLLRASLMEALRLTGTLAHGRGIVAQRAGVSVRSFFAWQTGERTHTTLDTADRLLLAIERNWWEVYDPQTNPPGLFKPRRCDDVLAWLDVVDRASRLWDGEVLLGPDDPVLEAERVAALEWAA
jgi:hypothetical protein